MALSDSALITIAEYAQYTGANVPTGLRTSQWEEAVEVASVWANQYTGRQFHKSDPDDTPVPSARYFEASGDKVNITDCYSITSVATDTADAGTYSTTVAASSYQLLPVNGFDDLLGAVPYTAIKQLSYGVWPCGYRERPIKVTGLWGWTAVPTNVKRAVAIVVQDLLRDPESNFGGLSVDANGVVLGSRVPTRSLTLIQPYVLVTRAPGLNVA